MKSRLLFLFLLVCALYSWQAIAKPEVIHYEVVKPIVVWAKEHKRTKETYSEFNLSQNTSEYSEFSGKCKTPMRDMLSRIYTAFGESAIVDPDSIPSSRETNMLMFAGLGIVNKDSISELVAKCEYLVEGVIAIQESRRASIENKNREALETKEKEHAKQKHIAFESKLDEHVSFVVESCTCLGLLQKTQRNIDEWYEKVKIVAKQNRFSGVYVNGVKSYIENLKNTASSPVERTLIRVKPSDHFKSYDQAENIAFYSDDDSETVLAVRNTNQVVMGARLKAQWIEFLKLGSYVTVLGSRKQYFLIKEVDGKQLGLPNGFTMETQYCAISNENLAKAIKFIKDNKKEDILIRSLNDSFDKNGLSQVQELSQINL